jgi:glycosyltransferase involved in cell wall biosynthesis
MRILQVLSTLNRGSGIAGVVMNYYKKIDRSRFSFDFLCFGTSDSTYEQEAILLGANIYFFSKPSVFNIFKVKRQLTALFEEHNYDVIHCHEILVARILQTVLKRANNPITFCCHAHNAKFSDSWIKGLRNKILCWGIYKTSHACLACSKLAARKTFGKRVFTSRDHRICILPNAVDYDRFRFSADDRAAFRHEHGISPEDFVIGHVGRFSKQKNHRFIIDVFSGCRKIAKNISLLLVGDGPLKKDVFKRAEKKKGIGTIIFSGNLKEIGAAFSAMDCFIFPSFYEGLGLVAVEASVNGLPIIVQSELPEELNAIHNIVRLELSDKASWIDAIADVYKKDRDTNVKLIRDSTVNEESFNINNTVEFLQSFYAELVK